MAVNVGMWLERFVIIPISLHRDFLPSSWGMYSPTLWDWGLFLGTMGLFTFLLFLFIKFVPMINIFEVKDLFYKYTARPHGGGHHNGHGGGSGDHNGGGHEHDGHRPEGGTVATEAH
jgi:hypothetical protein